MTDQPIEAEIIEELLDDLHPARTVLLFEAMESTSKLAVDVFGKKIAGSEGRSEKADAVWDVIAKSGTTKEFKKMMADMFTVIIGERVQPESSGVTLENYSFCMLVPIVKANHSYPLNKIMVVNKSGSDSGALRVSSDKGDKFMRSGDDLYKNFRLPTAEQVVEYFMSGDSGGPTIKQISNHFGSLTIENMPQMPNKSVIASGIISQTSAWSEINSALDSMYAEGKDKK
jgi:hypothetical protein